jgi:hypothetical protein
MAVQKAGGLLEVPEWLGGPSSECPEQWAHCTAAEDNQLADGLEASSSRDRIGFHLQSTLENMFRVLLALP